MRPSIEGKARMSNNLAILAGTKGGGTSGAALAYFAPVDTTGPTKATDIIPTTFMDAGWIDQSGLVVKANDTSKDVLGFGTQFPLRTIVSESKRTFDITFLETNHTTLEIYNRQPIGSMGTADGTGAFDVTVGAPNIVQYAGVFDVVDGLNHLRLYVPRLQVTSITDLQIKAGEPITYGVSFTAYPDASGNLFYEHVVVDALKYS
jgi:hypothetical protein